MKKHIVSQKILGYGNDARGSYSVALNTWDDGTTNYSVSRYPEGGLTDYRYVDHCPPISVTQEDFKKRLGQ